jgi:hypothetical protein
MIQSFDRYFEKTDGLETDYIKILYYDLAKDYCFLQVLFAESCKLKIQNVALWKIHSFAS